MATATRIIGGNAVFKDGCGGKASEKGKVMVMFFRQAVNLFVRKRRGTNANCYQEFYLGLTRNVVFLVILWSFSCSNPHVRLVRCGSARESSLKSLKNTRFA
ncbi:MAG: hypothetical protein ABW189_05530 [Rickettsiales bacterium]